MSAIQAMFLIACAGLLGFAIGVKTEHGLCVTRAAHHDALDSAIQR